MANKSFTILAIDDHSDNLVTIRAFLVDAFSNMTVLIASTGGEGIDLARQHHPSLILLDILMPNMDGYEVCRRMKQDPDIQHIPVVFLTAQKDNREVRIKAIEAGAEGFLSKPFDEKELIAQIRAMLKLSEANEQSHVEKLLLEKLVAKRTQQLEEELAERKKIELSLQKANFEKLFIRVTAWVYIEPGTKTPKGKKPKPRELWKTDMIVDDPAHRDLNLFIQEMFAAGSRYFDQEIEKEEVTVSTDLPEGRVTLGPLEFPEDDAAKAKAVTK